MSSQLIDKSKKTPLYEQLYLSLRGEIVTGKRRAGEKIPSKRRMAEMLDVSVTTVQNAYAQLISEGYLVARERSSLTVAEVERQHLPISRESRKPTPAVDAPYRLDLGAGGFDYTLFPFSVFTKYMRQTLAEREDVLLSKQDARGVLPLRSAIAEHVRRFRGMEVSAEQIVVGAGTEYLYGLLIQLLGRERVYGVEDPGYTKIYRVAEAAGAACLPLPLDEEGLSLSALAHSPVTVLHLSPSHHYPTGVVMSAARRHALLSWAAEEEGRYLIVDDYGSEFRLAGKPVPSLYELDNAERVIYLNTFSRSMSPSIRIGYMILPPSLLPAFRQKLGFYSGTVSGFEQFALAHFIESGAFERHLYRMRKHYRLLRDALIAALRSSSLVDRITVEGADAGLHFLLRIRTHRSDEELRERARAAGVRLSFLSDYCYAEAERCRALHTVVVNYSALRLDSVAEVVSVLQQIIV